MIQIVIALVVILILVYNNHKKLKQNKGDYENINYLLP